MDKHTSRILMVEDDDSHVELVRRAFDVSVNRYILTVVGTLREARDFLNEQTPRLILADWRLPDGYGTQLLTENENAIECPVLVMTSHGSEQVAVEVLKAGALDYIVKTSGSLLDMPHIVERALREWENLNERRRAETIQTALFQIAQAANRPGTLRDLIETIHQQLGTLIDATNFFVALYDPEHDHYTFPYWIDERDQDFGPQKMRKSLTDYIRVSGQPALITKARFDELMAAGEIEQFGPSAPLWMGAPLRTARGIIGVVTVQSYDDDMLYSAKDLDLLTVASEHIASVIERKQAEEAIRDSEERYRTLVEIAPIGISLSVLNGPVLMTNSALDEIFGSSLEELDRIIDLTQIYQNPEDRVRLLERLEADGSVTDFEVTLLRRNGEPFDASMTIVPFTEAGKDVVITLTTDITERKRAARELQERLEFEHLVAAMSTRLLDWSVADSNDALQDVLTQVAKFFRVDRITIHQIDDDGKSLSRTHAWRISGEETYSNGAPFAERFPWYTQKILRNEPIIAVDVDDLPDEASLEREHFARRGYVSHLGYPMMSHGEMVGSIGMSTLADRRVWTEETIQRIRVVEEIISGALLRHRAEAQIQKRTEEQEALLEIAQAVGSTLNLDKVLDQLLTHLSTLVPYSSASIALVKDDELRFVAGRGFPDTFDYAVAEQMLNEKNQWRGHVDARKPVIFPDVREVETWVPVPGSVEYIRSSMCVPLIHRDVLMGVLNIDHSEVDFYTADHARLARGVAHQVATAMENAQLFTEVEQRVIERTAELHAEKRQTDTILQNVADAILFTDIDANILYVNPAWERLTGYQAQEVIGENPRFLQSSKTPHTVYEELWGDILAGDVWQGVLYNRRKDGTDYDSELTVAPVMDESGAVRYFVGIQRDVTAARQLEAMKTRFIANAAHDLKNPITSLRLRLQLLKRAPDQAVSHINTMEHQIDHLTRLVTDLMTLSQLDQDEKQRTWTKLNLNYSILQVVESQAPIAEQKQIRLIFEPADDLSRIWGDVQRMERVILNLVTNALNYTLDGGEIVLKTMLKDERVMFTVRDTGIGIPSEKLPLIFERFYRSDEAREVTEGTGLGLAIVKEIVERHDGTITVKSKLGEGTVFTVSFPAGLRPRQQ